MAQNAEMNPEWIINHLDALMRRAAAGDIDSAANAHVVFTVLVDYLKNGGELPGDWDPRPTGATVGTLTTTVHTDEDGNWYVTVPSIGTDLADLVIEEDGGFALNLPDPYATVEPPAPKVMYYPKPEKATPGTPRTTSAANTDIPTDVPSTLGHGTFTEGMNNPVESHKVQAQMALRAGKFNHEVFWLIHDTPGGLADHEMERILNRSHQSLSATRNTLMNKGYIRASGEIRKTSYGNDAAVWVPTEWAAERVRRGLEKRVS